MEINWLNEFVRFYLDYGSGFQEQGLVSFNVHDIPDTLDCAEHSEKPLDYVLTRDIEPFKDYCGKVDLLRSVGRPFQAGRQEAAPATSIRRSQVPPHPAARPAALQADRAGSALRRQAC